MKICVRCKENKELTAFPPSYAKHGCGTNSYCRVCMRAVKATSKKKHREKHREATQKLDREWKNKNREKASAWRKRNYQRNKAARAAYHKIYMGMMAQAMPAWLTEEQKQQIRDIYKHSSKDIHVDHIVPIKGKTVCGLHVPWNLQLLPARENSSKHNKLLECAYA